MKMGLNIYTWASVWWSQRQEVILSQMSWHPGTQRVKVLNKSGKSLVQMCKEANALTNFGDVHLLDIESQEIGAGRDLTHDQSPSPLFAEWEAKPRGPVRFTQDFRAYSASFPYHTLLPLTWAFRSAVYFSGIKAKHLPAEVGCAHVLSRVWLFAEVEICGLFWAVLLP